MHILLVASAFNSLTQRALVELTELGHSVAVEVTPDGAAVRAAVARYEPELVIAPMLRAAIPPDVWSARTCLVVHPGPPGDRGPASLDRAIQEGAAEWGVTVLQAEAAMDAGAIWASVGCAVPPVGKSDLYRGEISDAAMEAVLLAVDRVASGAYLPRRQTDPAVRPHVRARPAVTQDERRIDWARDTTGTVLRKLRAADSRPGVLDELLGARWFLHGGHPEQRLRGEPGQLLATRAGAVCRATSDGAVWIPRLRARRSPGGPGTFALPAVTALGALLPDLPEVPARDADEDDWADIRYREQGAAGVLSFSVPGGALSTDVCRRLLTAYRHACARPTSVLVLGGGRDVFSNGIDLKTIEAAADPAAESWANITAMNELVEAVLTTTGRLVVAALGGNAGAGGVMLALAADEVWCRQGVVLNPHYRLMGLYGSEYWTYSLPRRVGPGTARRLTERALPVGATEAMRLGLVDRLLMCGPQDFAADVRRLAARLAGTSAAQARVAAKKADLERREAVKPLSAYRDAELTRMRAAFSDPDAPYHALRTAFVRGTTAP
ncbi:hydrogenase maturation protein [Streptomyces sp. NPDC002574]|uniref:hydrogenase maturation protein n=1 Tax=Streptomyces sp. NPDC002574 TaxID=3364652 RepID=UPI0036CE8A5E